MRLCTFFASLRGLNPPARRSKKRGSASGNIHIASSCPERIIDPKIASSVESTVAAVHTANDLRGISVRLVVVQVDGRKIYSGVPMNSCLSICLSSTSL